MSKVKKALVTGGAGFVGTNLIKRLVNEGHEVTSIDNYYTGLKSNHIDGCGYIKHDIADSPSLSVYGNFDIVYHLAAVARIQPSFDNPDKCFKANCTGTFNVAYHCLKNNIPLIYAGSSSHHSGKYKNPYTFTKDIGEDIITMFQKIYGLKASIARFYNVYGPHHLKKGEHCTVIGIWETAIENNQPLLITGNGLKRRDFTHINDIIDGLIKIDQCDAWGYTFELGRGKNYSIREVADMFEYDNIQYIEDRTGEARSTLCTDPLAKEILGWQPKFELQDYIKDYVKNYKNKK